MMIKLTTLDKLKKSWRTIKNQVKRVTALKKIHLLNSKNYKSTATQSKLKICIDYVVILAKSLSFIKFCLKFSNSKQLD